MFNESRPAARDGKPLIIVTDPDNGCDEDLLLTAYLRRAGFAVEVIGPEDFLDRSSQIQGVPVLARDLWPECNADHGLFERCKDTMLALARESGIQLWNSADGRGDQLGKEYLVALYADERFRDLVIPSAYLGEGSKNLPSSDRYIIKPIRGLSSLGIRMTTGEGLRELEALDGGVHREFIVQPEIRFEAERSFYFIDGEFQYCLDFGPQKSPIGQRLS